MAEKVVLEFGDEELKTHFLRWFATGGGKEGFGTPEGRVVSWSGKGDTLKATAPAAEKPAEDEAEDEK